MRCSRRIEFLVVGGGPAGSAAAMALAAAGREVVVVERTNYCGPRVGETLPPAANPILARLGLKDFLATASCLHCPGTICSWGRPDPYVNDFLFDPDGAGLHLDRGAFDAALAAKAVEAGAEVLVGCEVRSCIQGECGWKVETAGPREDRQFLVSTLIDAAGRRPWLGRPSRRLAFDLQVALVGMFEINGCGHAVDRRTWIEAACSGWWYSASIPDKRLVVAYFTDADLLHAPIGNRSALWESLLRQTYMTGHRLRGTHPLCDLRVVGASSTIADPIVRAGYVAVGDAACTIDPLSSQGILDALISGLDAAKALVDPNRTQAVRLYAKRIAAGFRDDLRTRQQFCRSEGRWPDSPFWRRRATRVPPW
jgi:flavin-dependent dehydrogenase